MPMHDWSTVEPTIFHHFHQPWSSGVADVLNAGLLPKGYSALIESPSSKLIADPLMVELVERANRIAIRHRLGEVVCIIEIVSPGNKASRSAISQFVAKTMEFLRGGVHVLLVDPFPPTPRDPHSLHKLIWDEIEEVPFEMLADEPLLLASYRIGDALVGLSPMAFLEPFRVGVAIPDMPAWLDADSYVMVPLERTYLETWNAAPTDYRFLIEHGRLPDG